MGLPELAWTGFQNFWHHEGDVLGGKDPLTLVASFFLTLLVIGLANQLWHRGIHSAKRQQDDSISFSLGFGGSRIFPTYHYYHLLCRHRCCEFLRSVIPGVAIRNRRIDFLLPGLQAMPGNLICSRSSARCGPVGISNGRQSINQQHALMFLLI